jgi:hypothetical protein
MPITFSKIGHLQPAQNNAAAALESLREGLAAIEQAANCGRPVIPAGNAMSLYPRASPQPR